MAALSTTGWRYDGGAACSLCGVGVATASSLRGILAGEGPEPESAADKAPAPPVEATCVQDILGRYSTRLITPAWAIRFSDAPAVGAKDYVELAAKTGDATSALACLGDAGTSAAVSSAVVEHPHELSHAHSQAPAATTLQTVAATMPYRALWCSLCARFCCVTHAAVEVPDDLPSTCEIWETIESPHAMAHDLAASSQTSRLYSSPLKQGAGTGFAMTVGGKSRGRKTSYRGRFKRARFQKSGIGSAPAPASSPEDYGSQGGSSSDDRGSDDDSAARQTSCEMTAERHDGATGLAGSAGFEKVVSGMRAMLKLPPGVPGGGAAAACGLQCYLHPTPASVSSLPQSEVDMLPRLFRMAHGDWCVIARLLGRPCEVVHQAAESSGLGRSLAGSDGVVDSLGTLTTTPHASISDARARALEVYKLQRRPFLVRQVRCGSSTLRVYLVDFMRCFVIVSCCRAFQFTEHAPAYAQSCRHCTLHA